MGAKETVFPEGVVSTWVGAYPGTVQTRAASATPVPVTIHDAGRMEWPRQVVLEEVDEKPWATFGSPPETAGISLDPSGDPWHADDVEPGPSSARSAIPARPRRRRPCPPPPPHPHPHSRSHPHAHARDHTTGAFLSPAHPSTPVRLLWPAGPLPLTSQTTRRLQRSSPVDEALRTTSASPRTAHLELLVSSRRAMDLLNDAAAHARASYRAAAQMAGSVWGALTSKTAQRTLVTTVLFALVSAVLFAVACVGYLAFYHNYLPDQVVELPVHLQYGYVLLFLCVSFPLSSSSPWHPAVTDLRFWPPSYAIDPYGVVSLADAHFAAYQDYDISLTLHLPRSPANLDRGNFMLALHLLDDAPAASAATDSMPPTAPTHVLAGHRILHTSTRPAIVPYTDPLVSLASRVLFLAYHIFVPASETVSLTVPLVERLEFRPGSMSPTRLVVDVQAGQTLQVYGATVTITAQLAGLRWFMHTWWVSAFVLFTSAFWFCEVFFLAMSFAVLQLLVFGGSGSDGAPSHPDLPRKIKDGEQQRRIKKEAEDDMPMTFPTSSGQPPLRYEPTVRAASTGGDARPADIAPAPGPGGEADDEYEDAGHEYEVAEERAGDSGLGTSYSERESGALRRRTSRGRVGG